MSELFIIIGVLFVVASGFSLGAWFSRVRGGGWAIGYGLALMLAILYWAGITYPTIAHNPMVSWFLMGRTKFAAVGFIAPLLLLPLLPRLKHRAERAVVVVFLVLVTSIHSVWPFVACDLNRATLAKLETRIDGEGVCLQNTEYTCGPASAVTVLRRLGIKGAEEGSIAIASHSSSVTGTPPDMLASALITLFGNQGVCCDYRGFADLAELKACGLTVAVMRFNFMVDHYVAVLKITDSEVVVGDPLNGIVKCSPLEFTKRWRMQGVVVSRR